MTHSIEEKVIEILKNASNDGGYDFNYNIKTRIVDKGIIDVQIKPKGRAKNLFLIHSADVKRIGSLLGAKLTFIELSDSTLTLSYFK